MLLEALKLYDNKFAQFGANGYLAEFSCLGMFWRGLKAKSEQENTKQNSKAQNRKSLNIINKVS